MFRVTVDDHVGPSSSASSSTPTHEKSYHYSVVTVTDVPSYRRRHASESSDGDHDAVAVENTPDDAVDAHDAPECVTFHRRRRYTDFKRLHDALTDPHGRYQARLPPMPKKAFVNTVAVVETRRETFRYVMDAVGRDYALRECEEVIDFLTRADEVRVGEGGGANASTATGRDVADAAEFTKRRAEDEDDDKDASRTREEEEEDVPLPPRDGRGLESLLASTMRVHGAKTVAGSSALAARRDGANADADETTTAATAAKTTTTESSSPVVALASTSTPSMAMSSLKPSTSTTYENTTAGAREAVKANDAAALDAVLRSGHVDVNGKDSSGMTLLHLACLFNRTSAVEVLLERGADPEIRNAQGETATEVASTTTRVFVEKTLKNRKK